MEEKINNINEQISLPENASSSFKLNELSKELEAAEAELGRAFEEWEALDS